MPRFCRTVIPGLAHHVTQRGVRATRVFFSDWHARFYLQLLNHYGKREGLQLLAYCLMPNHVHLVVIPGRETSLARTLRPVHRRYARHVNRENGWSGHLWQGRFFSVALDERHLWAAIRYVERNPVRAGLANKSTDYAWSSAAAHCGLRKDTFLTREMSWCSRLAGVPDWRSWLEEQDHAEELLRLRRRVGAHTPCASHEFIAELERDLGRSLRPRHAGRPRRQKAS